MTSEVDLISSSTSGIQMLRCLTVFMLLSIAPIASAALEGYRLSGTAMSSGTYYQHPIAANSSINVCFAYDVQSSVTHDFAPGVSGYLQNLAYGLRISVGEVQLRFNNYLLIVANDFDNSDRLSIAFDQNVP